MAATYLAAGTKRIADVGINNLVAVKLALVLDSYGTSVNKQHDYDDFSAHLAAGQTPQTVAIASENDAANNRIEIDVTTNGGSIVFSGVTSGQQIRHAILYEDQGGGTEVGLAVFTRDANLPSNGEDITVNCSQTDGSLTLSY